MKTSLTLLAVMAFAATQAAAVPSAEAKHKHGRIGFCRAPGTPCLKARDAEPEAEARHGRIGFCGAPGTPCLKARDAAPEAHRKGRLGFCGAPGTPCLKARDADDNDDSEPQGTEEGYCGVPGNPCNTVKRAAHAIADALAEARAVDSEGTFCGVPGAPCEKAKITIDRIADQAAHAYTKVYEREAEAVAEADPEARHGRIGFCGAPGTPCLKARDAEPEAEAHKHGRIGFCGAPGTPCLVGRDAMPHARGRIGFCGAPGTPCLVGRNAEAVAAARHGRIGFCGAPGTPCLKARDAEPEAEAKHKHGRIGFCGAPGTPCLKSRDAEAEPRHGRIGFCGAPGTPCLKARDAETIGKIISNTSPDYLKKECFKEGNECHTLLKVQQAFQKVKTEARAAEALEDPMTKFAHCGEKNAKCGVLTKAHQYAVQYNKDAAAGAEAECKGTDGVCTVAQRHLDELEETINAAVAGLNEEE